MSASIDYLPREENLHNPSYKKSNVIIVQQDDPNVIQYNNLPRHILAANYGILSASQILTHRVKLRLDFECKVSWHGSMTYKRLRGNSVLLSAPNPEQAELFIQAIHDFAASLNGKWLASKPDVVETKGQTP